VTYCLLVVPVGRRGRPVKPGADEAAAVGCVAARRRNGRQCKAGVFLREHPY
jgi:hypothetical protein